MKRDGMVVHDAAPLSFILQPDAFFAIFTALLTPSIIMLSSARNKIVLQY
jgi:hypothetical protein